MQHELVQPNSHESAQEQMTAMLAGVFAPQALVEYLSCLEIASLSPEVVKGYLEAIIQTARYRVDTRDFDVPVLDMAGTGGDGLRTPNVTTLALLTSAATELVVGAKYGNRAATSLMGSMDMLEAVGIKIDLSVEEVQQRLQTEAFAPLFAQAIYTDLRPLGKIRAQINNPTIFNFLMPMARPIIGQPRAVIGFSNPYQLAVAEKMYAAMPDQRVLLVTAPMVPTPIGGETHQATYMDEASVVGQGLTHYSLVDQGLVSQGVIDCEADLGIQPVPLTTIQVTSVAEAKQAFCQVLDPELASASDESMSLRNMVALNAALGLVVATSTEQDLRSLPELYQLCLQHLQSGAVQQLVQRLATNDRKDQLAKKVG